MSPGESWAQAQPLRQLFDQLSDAVLLLDAQARISFANIAALRSLSCEAGMPVDQLRATLGNAAVDWVRARVASHVLGRATSHGQPGTPDVELKDGRRVNLAWMPMDAVHSILRLQFVAAARNVAMPSVVPRAVPAAAAAELVRVLWRSPFPATLQDASFRIVDVNQAYLDFTGFARDKLIGIDPIEIRRLILANVPDDDYIGIRAHWSTK